MPLNPNYNQVITILHKRDGDWKKTEVEECFFRVSVSSNVDANGNEVLSDTALARIPFPAPEICKGDLIICGRIPETVTGESPNTASEILERYKPDAFRVAGVSNNCASFLGKHIKVVG